MLLIMDRLTRMKDEVGFNLEQAQNFMALAQSDDPAAAGKLADILREKPALWEVHGALTDRAVEQIAASLGGDHPVVALSVEAGYNRMINDLGYATAQPIVQLLIKHVALCYLRWQMTELAYNQHILDRGYSLTEGEFWERKQSEVQRRLLQAVRNLARLRDLLARTENRGGDKAEWTLEILRQLGQNNGHDTEHKELSG